MWRDKVEGLKVGDSASEGIYILIYHECVYATVRVSERAAQRTSLLARVVWRGLTAVGVAE